jgi:hypothetical protein
MSLPSSQNAMQFNVITTFLENNIKTDLLNHERGKSKAIPVTARGGR